MKKQFRIFLIIAAIVGYCNISFGQDSVYVKPRYWLYTRNYTNTMNTFEFDIFIKQDSINMDSTQFRYAAAQYFLNFNTGFANGGTLTYAIIASELPQAMWPINPTVFQNQLRLATNLPSFSNIAIVDTGGLVVVRMRLTNTVSWNFSEFINLRWRSANPNPFTKITAFTGLNNTVLTEIQDPTRNINDSILTGINPDPVASMIPKEFELAQNYPNPFNPSTQIKYAIPVDGHVTMRIYDIAGREVMNLLNDVKPAGFYTVNFNASNLSSGMYFYRLEVYSGNERKYMATKRMVLIK